MVGPYFTFFICAWIYLRHYLNIKILISEFTEFAYVGPYELDWDAGSYKCLLSQLISGGLLAALQSLNLFWLYYIFRIAYRFAFHNVAEDDRSDNDEKEFEEERRLDALAHEKAMEAYTPKMLINGKPLNTNGAANGTSNGTANGKTTATQTQANGTTNRRGNGKKA